MRVSLTAGGVTRCLFFPHSSLWSMHVSSVCCECPRWLLEVCVLVAGVVLIEKPTHAYLFFSKPVLIFWKGEKYYFKFNAGLDSC